jgi:hypothetical protein
MVVYSKSKTEFNWTGGEMFNIPGISDHEMQTGWLLRKIPERLTLKPLHSETITAISGGLFSA